MNSPTPKTNTLYCTGNVTIVFYIYMCVVEGIWMYFFGGETYENICSTWFIHVAWNYKGHNGVVFRSNGIFVLSCMKKYNNKHCMYDVQAVKLLSIIVSLYFGFEYYNKLFASYHFHNKMLRQLRVSSLWWCTIKFNSIFFVTA